MAIGVAARLAARAPVPVYCLENGGDRLSRYLHLDPRLRLTRSPRHASILLVAGNVPEEMAIAAANVHDLLPLPRGVVLWNCTQSSTLFTGDGVHTAGGGLPTEDIISLHRELIHGTKSSTPAIGPAENPVTWQGEGDHGQGGKGMMGGTPYGRPMAKTAADLRDGLKLGSTMVTIGPYLPWLPPGLRLHLTLQGDVVQKLECSVASVQTASMADIFQTALTESVSLAELELARARHHLQIIADLLFLSELEKLGRQTLTIARSLVAGRTAAVHKLQKAIHRSGFLLWSTRSVGRLADADLTGCGPLARATGSHEDIRNQDPAYAALDFEIVSRTGSDAAAVCIQRLEECLQALELAARASKELRQPGPPLEGPRGSLPFDRSQKVLDLLENQAVGMSWDTFVTLLVSLDLDCAALPPTPDFDEADRQHKDEEEEEDHGHHH